MDNDSEESTVEWNPTPLYAGQIKPLHRHTSPSSTESSVKTGKELVNVDPSNEKMEKINTMRELAMRRLAKRHKTAVLPHTAKRGTGTGNGKRRTLKKSIALSTF